MPLNKVQVACFLFRVAKEDQGHRGRIVSQQNFATASISGYHAVFLRRMSSSQ
jgi:hypothetical protein